MSKVGVSLGLALAALALCGCSNIQRVDLSQFQPYTGKDPYTGDDVSRSKSSSKPAKMAAARGMGVFVVEEPPSPKIDTTEPERLDADKAEPENRVKEAFQSICRGC